MEMTMRCRLILVDFCGRGRTGATGTWREARWQQFGVFITAIVAVRPLIGLAGAHSEYRNRILMCSLRHGAMEVHCKIQGDSAVIPAYLLGLHPLPSSNLAAFSALVSR